MAAENYIQLKITIAHIEPAIWRRVVVPNSISLNELHTIIQGAMGWQDCHLYSFAIGDEKFERPDPVEGLMDGYKDAGKAKLKPLLKPGVQFSYVYDFGDNWLHSIEVEATINDNTIIGNVICTAGERACPPEDCGGSPGYGNFVEAHQDKAHADHDHVVQWAPVFEPEIFSLTQANNLIFALKALGEFRE